MTHAVATQTTPKIVLRFRMENLRRNLVSDRILPRPNRVANRHAASGFGIGNHYSSPRLTLGYVRMCFVWKFPASVNSVSALIYAQNPDSSGKLPFVWRGVPHPRQTKPIVRFERERR